MDNLLDVLKGKPTVKEFKFGELKLKLRVLTRKEMDDVLCRLPSDNPIIQMEVMKKSVLGYSLVSLNSADVALHPDVREKMSTDDKVPQNRCVEELLGNIDINTLNILYDLYVSLMEEDRKAKELLKKDSAAQPAERSGLSSPN